jgi:hypothetical protein
MATQPSPLRTPTHRVGLYQPASLEDDDIREISTPGCRLRAESVRALRRLRSSLLHEPRDLARGEELGDDPPPARLSNPPTLLVKVLV